MTESKDEDSEHVPSSKYGSRRKGRLGKTDGRNVKRLWRAMIEAGATYPDGDPLTTGQIESLPGQPFEMNRLSNHLAKKPALFQCVGSVRVASLDGRTKYPQKTWLAHPDAYDSQ
jgi:hypothetical protein|tara:strand:- start:4770 stop:5114 length:345 start_codon:yes stop_codon:yes gene_type:complete